MNKITLDALPGKNINKNNRSRKGSLHNTYGQTEYLKTDINEAKGNDYNDFQFRKTEKTNPFQSV